MTDPERLEDLTRRQRRGLWLIAVLVVASVVVWILRPSIAAYAVIAATSVSAGLVIWLGWSIDIHGPATATERLGGAVVATSGLLIVGVGISILRAGGITTWLWGRGVVAGALVAVAIVVLNDLAAERPRIAVGVLAILLLVGASSGLWAVLHLIGLSYHPTEAALTASGFLGLIGVFGIVVGIRIARRGIGTVGRGLHSMFE